jgi:hypothetical protein
MKGFCSIGLAIKEDVESTIIALGKVAIPEKFVSGITWGNTCVNIWGWKPLFVGLPNMVLVKGAEELGNRGVPLFIKELLSCFQGSPSLIILSDGSLGLLGLIRLNRLELKFVWFLLPSLTQSLVPIRSCNVSGLVYGGFKKTFYVSCMGWSGFKFSTEAIRDNVGWGVFDRLGGYSGSSDSSIIEDEWVCRT